ncbi:FAD-dependent oxidoreductase [Rhizobiaceae bacterium]|nr:FAD-dependent oxidoreductase [Rhizobiaceae bacterium]
MREIVLVGLGHAHLHVASRAEEFRRAGLRVTLIDDGSFWYSSIGSGLLGGRYEREDDVIEADAFAKQFGVNFVRGRAASLDRAARDVVLESGERVSYDLVSINTGSRTVPPFSVSGSGVSYPKPIQGLLELRGSLKAAFDDGRSVRWLTVGGNHSGCELTLNALAFARQCGASLSATLVTSGSELIGNEPKGARVAMRGVLEGYGCDVRTGSKVARILDGRAELQGGEAIAFDHAMVATGLQASPLAAACDLRADARGLLVNDTLHAPADDRVFAAGDCARIDGYDLPKVGVFGVRAAPVLTDNLMRRAAGRALRRYKPQPIWFAAQNLGDGTGMASWGPVWWRGPSALRLKDWNDRRFMKLYSPGSK